MNPAEAPALSSALELRRSPRAARPGSSDALPPGVLLLVRIVAGDEQALFEARDASAEPVEVIREASGFYLQQVLFAADANSYRVLGVNPGDDHERIREHYRWLARWLHPDRNPDAWEVVYAERVSSAWQNLRTPDRRERYDRALMESELANREPVRSGPAPGIAPIQSRTGDEYDMPSERLSLRWLPSAILGALGVMALGVVLLYVLRMREEAEANHQPSELAEQAPSAITPVHLQPPASPPSTQLPAAPPETAPPAAPAPLASAAPAPPETPRELASPARSATEPPASPAPEVHAPIAAAVRPTAVLPAVVPPPIRLPAPPAPAKAPELSVASRETSKAPRAAPSPPAPVAVAAVQNEPTIAQTPEPKPPAPAPTATGRIGQADANRLLGYFSRAYEQGDINGMRQLFASDVRGPDGGLREILAGYGRVFESSTERSLHVHDVNWFEDGETVSIVAGYDASLTNRDGKPRRTRGDLRLDLRRENDRWLIYRLRHDERPG